MTGYRIQSFPRSRRIIIDGMAERPGIIDGRLVQRTFLDLNFTFDHDIIDDAPAARFTALLRESLELASALDNT